ncbi:MAG: DUF1201 domain-containing protein [Prevotella sp.]|nr:DUF1201 domain-containing protein [Prevotella sp.]
MCVACFLLVYKQIIFLSTTQSSTARPFRKWL